jgi:hypothetical protein
MIIFISPPVSTDNTAIPDHRKITGDIFTNDGKKSGFRGLPGNNTVLKNRR